MRIRLMLPNRTLLDEEVSKITAPGTEGSFQLLPKHVDVVWSLQTGILAVTMKGQDAYYAIDRGVLVKQGEMVYVSCFEAIRGDSLEKLNATINEKFSEIDDREKKTREVLLRMEMSTKMRLGQIEQ